MLQPVEGVFRARLANSSGARRDSEKPGFVLGSSALSQATLNAIGDAAMLAYWKVGWAGIRRAVKLHGCSVPLARCRENNNTSSLSKSTLDADSFHPNLFDVWFTLILCERAHGRRWHEKSRRSGVNVNMFTPSLWNQVFAKRHQTPDSICAASR